MCTQVKEVRFGFKLFINLVESGNDSPTIDNVNDVDVDESKNCAMTSPSN